MNLPSFSGHNKKLWITSGVVLSIILIYSLLHFCLFEKDPVITFLGFINNQYLNLSLFCARAVHSHLGPLPFPNGFSEIFDPEPWIPYTPEVRYKKVLFLFLLIIWLVKSPLRKKLFCSFIMIMGHLFSVILYNSYGIELSPATDPRPVLALPETIALLLLFALANIWYLNNKQNVLKALSKLKINAQSFGPKIQPLFFIIYFYILLENYVFDFFQFYPWINIIFSITQKILALAGYPSTVDAVYLIGEYGTIYMAKYCLGFKTMYLFAAMVYLTGDKTKTKLLYILAGLFFINFVNILRFVFLFIHIQKNGDYALAMDLHDLYNIVIYSTVFILWVIWFERFSDISIGKKKKIATKYT